MKHWFAAIAAAVLVLAAGTALASIPSGSSTSFSVADPAVTILGSGQTPIVEGAEERCEWSSSGLTLCPISTPPVGPAPAITPSADGICQVNLAAVMNGEPAGFSHLDGVGYGIAVSVEGTPTDEFDAHGLTTTPTEAGEQSVSRTRLVPVEAGVEYSFSPWFRGAGSPGVGYWDLSYVCF